MKEFQYLIPEESSDALISQVTILRQIENQLRQLFINSSYKEVLLPPFEYVDFYSDMDIGLEEEKLFQFINHEGKRIALRADFTLPLARLYVCQKNNDIQRYCYFGSVYRKEKRHKGRNNECYQAGIELIGKQGCEGEKECLQLVQETVKCLGLKKVKIVIGSARFYHRLCEVFGEEMVDILKIRSFSLMKDFIRKKSIEGYLKDFLLMLLSEIDRFEMLEDMIQFVDDDILKESLIELKEIYNELDNKDISFDFAMTPLMKYYNGMMIRVYTPYSAQPILTGGRYDHLMTSFHQDVPAIGFSYDLHSLLNALEKEKENND